MGLIEDLGPGPTAVDTAPLIYFIEGSPEYLPVIEPLFAAADRGERLLVTSGVSLLEVLVAPYRVGNVALAERYEALLTRSRGLRLVDIDRGQLRSAAQVRAVHRVRTPDALQIAAALSTGCGALVTNDRELPEIPGLRILQLRDYLLRPHAAPRARASIRRRKRPEVRGAGGGAVSAAASAGRGGGRGPGP